MQVVEVEEQLMVLEIKQVDQVEQAEVEQVLQDHLMDQEHLEQLTLVVEVEVVDINNHQLRK